MDDALLRSDQARLALALSSARMGTWDWEVSTHIIRWDEEMHRLFGLEPGTFSGRYEDFLLLMDGKDRDRIRAEFARAVAECAEVDGEFRLISADGGVRVVRIRSKVHGNGRRVRRIIGVCWDVTEKRHVDLALAKERSLLKTLMDNLPDHIYFKDLDSRFVAVNRAMAKWVGIADPALMIGKTDRDLFSGEHAEKALKDEQEIIRTGKPIINREEMETWPDREPTWVSTTKMPLHDAQGNTIGTFGLSRNVTDRKLADEKVARLAHELREKNEALQEDLEMARELQSAMMPQQFPHFPQTATEQDSAVRFYHFFQPSMTVSGDFFDVLRISDDKAGLFICDVMGHGVRAALVAATLRTLINELRPIWPDPGEFFCQLNHALCEALKNSNVTLFASAVYVVADLSNGELRYANAGHPHPLRVARPDAGSGESAPLNGQRPGPALGLFDGAVYRTSRCELSPHDVVLLFTDGLFEVEGAGGCLYDYRQLTRAVGNRTGLPTLELCRSLIAEVQQFSATRSFNDDVCLVAMEIDRPAASSASNAGA